MRTTLDIDDDVLYAVRELASADKKTAGQVVSELLRKALDVENSGPDTEKTRDFMGFSPLPKRGVVVTNEHINQLRDELGI